MSGAEIVVEAKNLQRIYEVRRGLFRPSAQLRAVGDISFRLERGRTLAVVGESGCGKSTLARMVALIEKPTAGQLTLVGHDAVNPPSERRRELRQAVQLVFQNPYGSLNPRKKVAAVLEDPLAINTTLGKSERAAKAREMLARVGLRPEHANRYPHMFSGGQRQRIAIARALMLEPRLVVADEPVSALDVSVRAQVLNLLNALRGRLGLSMLFISHDLAVVRNVADRVAVMFLGAICEIGPAREVLERPAHPYTAALLSAVPRADPGLQPRRIALRGEMPSPMALPAGCRFRTRCPGAQAACAAAAPPLACLPDGREVACHFPFSVAVPPPAAVAPLEPEEITA